MKRIRLAIFVALLVAAAALLLLRVLVPSDRDASAAGQAGSADQATPSQDSTATGQATAGQGPAAAAADRHRQDGVARAPGKGVTHQPGARTVIPRSPRPAAPAPAMASSADESAKAQARSDEIVDRRENPGKDSAAVMKRVQAGLEQVRDDVESCLAAWSEFDPAIEGDVMLGFTIDKNGLGEVWIDDYVDIPAASLTCFSAAVYDVDWTGVTEEPVQITYPYGYHPGEAEGD